MRWVTRILVLLVVAALATMIALAMQEQPQPVELVTATTGSVRVTIDEEARTRVRERYVISVPLDGAMERITLDVGDSVQAGDVIAKLHPTQAPLLDPRKRAEAEAALKVAESRVELARKEHGEALVRRDFYKGELERLTKPGNDFSESEIERARMEASAWSRQEEAASFRITVASYELELSRASLQRFVDASTDDASDAITIRAPISGHVLRSFQKSEAVVSAGTLLLEVADTSKLEIVAEVLTSQATTIAMGAKADVVGWGGATLSAQVREIEASAFTKLSALGVEEQRVNVLLDFTSPEHEWQRLGDGYRLEVRILSAEARDTTLVPISTLFRRGAGERAAWSCFVIGPESRLLEREVEIGLRNQFQAQVLSGLRAGEQVVAYPAQSLSPGTLVSGVGE